MTRAALVHVDPAGQPAAGMAARATLMGDRRRARPFAGGVLLGMAAATARARWRGEHRAHMTRVGELQVEQARRREWRISGALEIATRMTGRAHLAREPVFLVAA